MKENGINFEVKSRVTTMEFHLLFNGIDYTLKAIDEYNGHATFFLTGVVLGKEYTLSFIHNDMFVSDDIILDYLKKFEKLYY